MPVSEDGREFVGIPLNNCIRVVGGYPFLEIGGIHQCVVCLNTLEHGGLRSTGEYRIYKCPNHLEPKLNEELLNAHSA